VIEIGLTVECGVLKQTCHHLEYVVLTVRRMSAKCAILTDCANYFVCDELKVNLMALECEVLKEFNQVVLCVMY
jgi:hypothetical protein